MEIQGYIMPDDLYYEENHYWIKADGESLVMGMDDFAQKLAGEIVYVQLPFIGKRLTARQKFAQVESGKWLGKIYAPVTGEIAEVNSELESSPSLINKDPYGNGWMFKIKPDSMSEIENLIHGREAVERWLIADIEKYAKK